MDPKIYDQDKAQDMAQLTRDHGDEVDCFNDMLLGVQDRAYLQGYLRGMSRGRSEVAEALTPSPETKAAYFGEVKVDGQSPELVPWTNIKEIMAMIRERAAVQEKPTSML